MTCDGTPSNANQADPIWRNLTLQHIMAIFGGTCAFIVGLLSLFLIFKHLRSYTKPREQRQIIRLVFTPFVFAIFSTLAIAFYSDSIYLEAIRDCYEAFALVALFLLFVQFVAPDEASRENYFHNLENRNRRGKPQSGGSLKWFHIRWICVFQYVIGRPITALVTIVTQAEGAYCYSSNNVKHAHMWVTVIQTIDTVIIFLAIIYFYRRLKAEMAGRHPLSKLVAFKGIIFLSLLQSLVFNFLLTGGHLNPSNTVSYNDYAFGIPSLLLCAEMVFFAITFLFVFRTRPYSNHHTRVSHSSSFEPGPKDEQLVNLSFGRAVLDALNPTDYFYGLAYAFRVLFSGKTNRLYQPQGQFATANGVPIAVHYNSQDMPAPVPYSPPGYQGRR